MTLQEAAGQLGLDASTLRHQIRNGRLKATKRGRDWWVTPSEVARYRQDHGGRKGWGARQAQGSRSTTR